MYRFTGKQFALFLRMLIAFTLCFITVRIFEYILLFPKVFVKNVHIYEMQGLLYDVWFCCIYGLLSFALFRLIELLLNRAAAIITHILNIGILMFYVSLIITFSERNNPLDRELLTRSSKETMTTVKQMASSGFSVFIPFILFIILYVGLNRMLRTVSVKQKTFAAAVCVFFLATAFISFANPSQDTFSDKTKYYLTANKFSYLIADNYRYLNENKKEHLSDAALSTAVDFYQANHPFKFVSKEYPLLHEREDDDVLGPFFNLKKEKPNIVLLVVEGLSRDFSGRNAYAYSFTPFLDSLSDHSLTWDNFLSTAPGTFAAHPAISGSLPYAKRGFSIMNVMPFHNSVIKICKANGYYTNFMIGFNPDFDNMGGYIRQQGTDFILSHYPAKYKEMGVGEEGWSMGYPDDALYERSFSVLDSIHTQPYLSIYHTATTHMPYLFAQQHTYEKLFDEKMKSIKVSSEIKKTLKATKKVLITYMFSDDCIRKFFSDYSKRPEFSNTIFLITGDHHIGSFPTKNLIDDYHVPLMIWSPMLKQARRFYSVNTHNNIAPTLTNFLSKNYALSYKPHRVHWLAGVLDTAVQFRNEQSMPFMWWDRDINDYIWKNYFLSEDQLYSLEPNMMLKKIKNDSVRNHMIALRENFKIINNYVCDNDKIFPRSELTSDTVLLKQFNKPQEVKIFTHLPDTAITADYIIPKNTAFLYVRTTATVDLLTSYENYHPTIRYALIDTTNRGRKYLYWSKRDIETLSHGDYKQGTWNNISVEDVFPLNDYKKIKNLIFETAIYTDSTPINLKMKNLRVQIFEIGNKK